MNNLSNNPFVRPNSNEKRRLSQHVAKTATSTFRTKWIRDTQVPGFALRIEKTGSKSWTFGYPHKATSFTTECNQSFRHKAGPISSLEPSLNRDKRNRCKSCSEDNPSNMRATTRPYPGPIPKPWALIPVAR